MRRETEGTYNELTPTLTYDAGMQKLTVRGGSGFPKEVLDYPEPIAILDLVGNHIQTVPDELAVMEDLRIIFLSQNPLHEVPKALAGCQSLEMVGLKSCQLESLSADSLPANLRGLIVTDNHLSELPTEIGSLSQLQKLMLTGNQLTSLPDTLQRCQNLELLRIAHNHLETVPNLNELSQLAWYADSANRYNQVPDLMDETRRVRWSDLSIQEKLGESSKNVVYAAILPDGTHVAVKLFGQGVTTDGLPADDIAACLRAGNHPGLVGGLGIVDDESMEPRGLIMPLIPYSYRPLAMPPDMVSLTRDVYPGAACYDDAFIRRVAISLSSALAHLHSRGIMHGDVYGHNLLVTQTGQSKLADFGAATLYDTSDLTEQWREQVDILGYGHLLQELIERSTSSGAALGDLEELTAACLSYEPARRPHFSDVMTALS